MIRAFRVMVLIFLLGTVGWFNGGTERNAWMNASHDKIFADTTTAFKLLEDLFSQAEPAPGEDTALICRGFHDLVEIQQYLEQGFTSELAASLTELYFYTSPDSDWVWLRPMESIPLLHEEDKDLCTIYWEQRLAIVQIDYEDVYALGDHYWYSVVLEPMSGEKHYRIQAIQWESLNDK